MKKDVFSNQLTKMLPPPRGKNGWPWTRRSKKGPRKIGKNLNWPKISIITPNFNSGRFLERAIRSVIMQGYPNLEYIIIDGGSTDTSLKIIEKYRPWIDYFVSRKDKGQSSATNKGFKHATGDIVNWLCSDDMLSPDALFAVGENFMTKPYIDVLVGRARVIREGKFVKKAVRGLNKFYIPLLPFYNSIPQSSCFYKRRLLRKTKPLKEYYHYAMDLELWNYFSKCKVCWHSIDSVISVNYQTRQCKTWIIGKEARVELADIFKKYSKQISLTPNTLNIVFKISLLLLEEEYYALAWRVVKENIAHIDNPELRSAFLDYSAGIDLLVGGSRKRGQILIEKSIHSMICHKLMSRDMIKEAIATYCLIQTKRRKKF